MSTEHSPNNTMQYVRLGSSGLKISKIILGCMSYGTPEWQPWVLAEEEGIKHIKAAYEMGITTFDTANTYSNGESEVILGKAINQLKLPRDEIVVMTKVFFAVGPTPKSPAIFSSQGTLETPKGYVNQRGLSRKHIFDSVKHSLARLQLDYIDVLLCHRFDKETPIAETMQALHDVVQAGFVRYVGMSSCWAWQFHAMQNYAINNHLTPFVAMENHYSLLYREEEREMMPTLKLFGVGSIPWSPLARGRLARPAVDKEETTRGKEDKLVAGYENDDVVARVEELAKKKDVSMARISLAWSMTKVTAPIVGTTSLDNLRDIVGAVDVKLSEEEIKYLEEPYRPLKIFGHS